MRSFIIIEVEHGEDTDGLQQMIAGFRYAGDNYRVKNYTVKVNVHEGFTFN